MNPTATLHPDALDAVQGGYPRVLQKWVTDKQGDITPGCVIDVLDASGQFVARGLANPYSRILVRVLSYDADQSIDEAFFHRRLVEAEQMRVRYAPDRSYRAVFSEADWLPGLIVDRFEDRFVCQIGTMGMEVRREMLFAMLREIYSPACILEKSSAGMRKPERLQPRIEVIMGNWPERFPFQHNGLTYLNDVAQGQKTGFFLDQRDNRMALARYVHEGDRVLDGFCYTGGFTLMAARMGADVLAFDISEHALEIAAAAAHLNGLEARCRFEQNNGFAQLRDLETEGATFDVVILDPPAFAKHRGVLPNALRGYRIINRRAIRILREGGVLVSCSCTQQVSEQAFLEVLDQAANDVGRPLHLLEIRGQPFDHPVLATLPEMRYLKCVIAQVG